MSLFDNSITTTKCGKYIIENTTGIENTLYLSKITSSVILDYSFEDVANITLADGESYTLVIPNADIYKLYWESDDTDEALIINTCFINDCLLKMINNLMCDDCDDSCVNIKMQNKILMLNMLYIYLQDLMAIHFDSVEAWYPMIEEIDDLYTMYELLDKINDICNCN